MFKIDSNVADVRKYMRGVHADQLPYATMLAINNTAFAVKAHLVEKMKELLDRPKAFTLRSLKVAPKATKKTLEAMVSFRVWGAHKGVPAEEYLKPVVFGGSRPAKRSEKLLRQHGYFQGKSGILASDEFVVPSTDRYLDNYGNLKASEVTKMLSALQTTIDTAQRSKGVKKNAFFVTVRNGKKIIFKKINKNVIVPFMTVINKPKYKKIFKFNKIVNEFVKHHFPGEFQKAMAKAIQTKKPKIGSLP